MEHVINNRYKYFSELIGEGRTSKVFRGIDTAANREIAIKVMTDIDDARTQSGYMRIIPKHPCFCEYMDYLEEQQYAYIITGYSNSERLGYYKYGKVYEPCKAMKITANLLQGIDHLHKAGLLHCDLSPHNILISKDQESIQIIDFGCTVRKDRNGEYIGSHPGGTLGFAPPELIPRASRLNDSSDLYSIACITLYLLNGKAPFHIETACKQVKNPDLQRILLKATSYQKSGRYQSAGEMLEALHPLIEIDMKG